MFVLEPDRFIGFHLKKAKDFIDFWNKYHKDTPPTIFGSDQRIDYMTELNIENNLTEENIRRLLRWKSKLHLTDTRKNPNAKVRKVLARIKELNKFRNGNLVEEKFKEIAEQIFTSGYVYRTFLFHICRPGEYPILDRYVLLSFSYHTGNSSDASWDNYLKYKNYFFTIADHLKIEDKNTCKYIQSLKRIDNALWVFGQFLMAYGLKHKN